MQFVRRIDQLLSSITMYRLVLYGLAILAATALAFSGMGALELPWVGLAGSLLVLLGVCYVTNWLLATLWSAPSGVESSLITALILFFVLAPLTTVGDVALVALAGLVAMASKYVLAWRRKHIFNPAALAAAVVGVSGLYPASWWVATPIMLPFSLLLGLLVVRKLRRFRLFLSFVVAAVVVILVVNRDQPAMSVLLTLVASWPLVFLGTIMLTEPSTVPSRNRDILLYGALVGAVFTSQTHIGFLYSAPAIALLLGNLYSYIVSPKYRLRLKLAQRLDLSPDITEFRFTADRAFAFTPGQYMDVILPHAHADGRGNRRTFSISSSPTETTIQLTTRFYDPSSSFKQALRQLEIGRSLTAGQLSGNFVLPPDAGQKLIWIAGGIGITPFRSMAQYLLDTKQTRDITLFYSANAASDFVYRELLETARTVGVKTHYLLTGKQIPADWQGETGFLTADIVKRAVPEHQAAVYMLSGPNVMVESYRTMLRQVGVPRRQIMTDYFSGF